MLIGTGSIMVSVLPAWVMVLRDRYGWNITGCVTRTAAELVRPAALAAACGRPVIGPGWDAGTGEVVHRWAAEWADLVLAAPATNNFLAKCAHGFSDDVASATVAFTEAPVVLAPALGRRLLSAPATERNLALLAGDGRALVPTTTGRAAFNGAAEPGMMPDLPAVLDVVAKAVRSNAA
nr:flavoprotein [Saccharopolyspora gloriosae]